MDIVTLYETINNNPLCCFVAGLVVGYLLHALVARRFSSHSRNKKPSRYQNKTSESSPKRPTSIADLQEPAFDLPEAVVKTLTPRRLSGVALDHGSEL